MNFTIEKLKTIKYPLLFTLILAIIITLSVYPNFEITCNHYVMNTYLYITMSFTLLYVFLQLYEVLNIDIKYILNSANIIGILICNIALIFFIFITPPQYLVIKHILWILFLAGNGYILYPLKKKTTNDIFHNTFITTIIITFILSCMVYIYPNIVSFSIGPILFIALLVLIITQIVNIYITRSDKETMNKNQKWLSIFSILLFSLFILYDTKVLLRNAETCNIRSHYPDYIKESFNIFLDILNTFINLLHINNN